MDAVFSTVNLTISCFAFIEGALYIKNSENSRDWWWNLNAAMIIIAAMGIILNFYIILHPNRGGDSSLLRKSQLADQAADLIGQIHSQH